MEMDASSSLHIVICPWLAFGHILPSLELADRLASRGHRISLVSTPRNISRLPPLRAAVAPLVDLVALTLPLVGGLPDGAESTHDVTHDEAELHRLATDGLAVPFSDFMRAACDGKKKPDWVIVDTLSYWAAPAAVEHGVPCAAFFMVPASLFTPWTGRLSQHDDDWEKVFTTPSTSGMSVFERCAMTLKLSKLVGIRTCVELEPEAVSLVATGHESGRPFVPFGLLPPAPPTTEGRNSGEDDATLRWLDAQPVNSVVYVALGSEVPLRLEQVHEMAIGLELAGRRFLWALRKPGGASDTQDLLPPGFEERTRGRGLVVYGWAPQLKILGHGAVAAFVTHCGWSSTIEALHFGRPLIMLPIAIGDQWLNARLIEEKQAGVQVPRHGNDGSFDREGFASTVRAVTAEEGIFATNAMKLQQIVADRKCHERCIDGFIQQLRSHME